MGAVVVGAVGATLGATGGVAVGAPIVTGNVVPAIVILQVPEVVGESGVTEIVPDFGTVMETQLSHETMRGGVPPLTVNCCGPALALANVSGAESVIVVDELV